MRPRIRTLKPECWQDQKLGRVSRDARLLWTVLITLADDEGRFLSLPSVVLGHGYPYDSDAPKKLAGWMGELTDERLVEVYEADGIQYGWLPKWELHQKVNKAKASTLAAPPSRNGNGSRPDDPRRES